MGKNNQGETIKVFDCTKDRTQEKIHGLNTLRAMFKQYRDEETIGH